MLLCLVNGVLDIKLIESGKYEPKFDLFNPLETLQFIKDIFSPYVKMQQSELAFKATSMSALNEAIVSKHQEHLLPPQALPELLRGDQVRL